MEMGSVLPGPAPSRVSRRGQAWPGRTHLFIVTHLPRGPAPPMPDTTLQMLPFCLSVIVPFGREPVETNRLGSCSRGPAGWARGLVRGAWGLGRGGRSAAPQDALSCQTLGRAVDPLQLSGERGAEVKWSMKKTVPGPRAEFRHLTGWLRKGMRE